MLKKENLLKINYFIDNEYLDKYINLINTNRNTKKIKYETNLHHIIPRHYFTHNNLDIDNSKENKVNLYFKDHMLAHFYLAGCTKGQDKYWNLYSIYLLSGKSTNQLDIEFIESLEDFNFIYENSIKSEYNHRKGCKVSEDTRNRMKEAQQLRVKKFGATNKNYVWVNNNIKDYMIPRDELELYEQDGFKKGRLYKHSKETKEKIGEKAKNRVISDDFRKKMSEIAKKQVCSEEKRKKLSEYAKARVGEKNSFYGKKHSKESNLKNRLSHINKIWVTNGYITKMIEKEDLDLFISKGFIKGRKLYNKN